MSKIIIHTGESCTDEHSPRHPYLAAVKAKQIIDSIDKDSTHPYE